MAPEAKRLSFVLISVAGLVWAYADGSGTVDLTKLPGHLERFGSGRPSFPVEETNGFPDSKTFFRDYVSSHKPLKMSGAAKNFKAFQQWNDAYFAGLKALDDEEVLIESRKKENRTNPPSFMSLREFVKIYNNTDKYMVNTVPNALKADMVLPCPIQCAPVVESALVDALMWFSSGGTKSVVHTDSGENINCLMRGEKEFVMVDPELYGDKVDLDHPEGSYSDVDVDAVDYTKYPDLADVEFFQMNMTAGDCLYIPFRWIHQVRSYGSNLAVNIWWDHYKTRDLNPSECPTKCNESLTLDKVNFNSETSKTMLEELKDHVDTIMSIHSEVSADKFVEQFLFDDVPMSFDDVASVGNGYKTLVRKIFEVLDSDSDKTLTSTELERLGPEIWRKARDVMLELEAFLTENENDFAKNYDEEDEELKEEVQLGLSGDFPDESRDEL